MGTWKARVRLPAKEPLQKFKHSDCDIYVLMECLNARKKANDNLSSQCGHSMGPFQSTQYKCVSNLYMLYECACFTTILTTTLFTYLCIYLSKSTMCLIVTNISGIS